MSLPVAQDPRVPKAAKRPADPLSRQLLRRVAQLGFIAILSFVLAFALAWMFTRGQIEDDLRRAGERARLTFDQILLGLRQDLAATSDALRFGIDDAQQRRGLLRGVLDRQTEVFALTLTNFDGEIIELRQRLARSSASVELQGDTWLSSVALGEVFVSPVYFIHSEQGTPVAFLQLAFPVRDKDGRPQAALVAHLDLTALWQQLQELRVGRSGEAFITDAEGRLLVHPDLGLAGEQRVLEALRDRDPAAGEFLLSYRSFKGYSVRAAAWPLEAADWFVVTEQPWMEAMAPALLTSLVLVVLLSGLATLVYGIVQFIRERLVSPLTDLHTGVDALAGGDLGVRIHLHNLDELGELAEAFNDMAGALQHNIGELEEARVHLEQRVQARTAELRQANDEMKGLVYIVSHDLRAPLINLKGFAGELRQCVKDAKPALDAARPHLSPEHIQQLQYSFEEDIPEALDFIDTSVERMDGFIEALLRLSRAGHRELMPEEVDVEDLVGRILQSFAYQVEQSGARVEIAKLHRVTADPMALEQVLSNLLTNALNYSASEGQPRLRLSSERSERETLYRVRDNGPGIAREHLDQVFQPFRRFGTNNTSPGEGMGLAYARALVRRHGGRIWCESQLGEGTTFLFTIAHQLQPHGETGQFLVPESLAGNHDAASRSSS